MHGSQHLFGSIVMSLQVGGEDVLFAVTNWTYVIAPVGAGVLLTLAGRRTGGPGTAGWSPGSSAGA